MHVMPWILQTFPGHKVCPWDSILFATIMSICQELHAHCFCKKLLRQDVGTYIWRRDLQMENVACRQLGFPVEDGFLRNLQQEFVPPEITLLPSWFGSISCGGEEDTITECDDLVFGDATPCGFVQRLGCSNGTGEQPLFRMKHDLCSRLMMKV